MGDRTARVRAGNTSSCQNNSPDSVYSRRDLLKKGAALGVAGAFSGSLLGGGCSKLSSQAPKHVILISIDTLRKDHLPFYGYNRQTAPNISQLAQSSVIFDDAIAASTNTAPSHASMFTGMHPLSHGVLYNTSMLSPKAPTLGEILGSHGFTTAGFTSCIVMHSMATGLDKGFEYYSEIGPPIGQRASIKTFMEALNWLETVDSNQRVFLFFHAFDPHFPYNAPNGQVHPTWPPVDIPKDLPRDFQSLQQKVQEGLSPEEIQALVHWYDEEILYADKQIGRLLQVLKIKGMYDDSLIIFLSDHGETLGERPWKFDHGGRVTEEQIQVPLFFRFPGGKHGGVRIPAAVHHVDIAPTVLDILGFPIPDSMEGISLANAPSAPGDIEERFMFSVARSDPRRYPEMGEPIEPGQLISSIRRYPHKLKSFPGKGNIPFIKLYDLKADPMETIDLSKSQPHIAMDLQRRLVRWLDQSQTTGQHFRQNTLAPEWEKAVRSLGYVE